VLRLGQKTSVQGIREVPFNSVDVVGNYHVFNIGGNKYRLIAFIKYTAQICYIKHILTHKEYDKGTWK
jgi:mRNA interferase HigB